MKRRSFFAFLMGTILASKALPLKSESDPATPLRPGYLPGYLYIAITDQSFREKYNALPPGRQWCMDRDSPLAKKGWVSFRDHSLSSSGMQVFWVTCHVSGLWPGMLNDANDCGVNIMHGEAQAAIKGKRLPE